MTRPPNIKYSIPPIGADGGHDGGGFSHAQGSQLQGLVKQGFACANVSETLPIIIITVSKNTLK